MPRFFTVLSLGGAVFLAVVTGIFFWGLGVRSLTSWTCLLASLTFASSGVERFRKYSKRFTQLFTVLLVSQLSFFTVKVWQAKGTGESGELGDLLPLMLIALLAMLLGMLMIQIGLKLRRRN